MKNFFENIKQESQKNIINMVNKELSKYQNHKAIDVLKSFKFGLQFSNIAAAIIFTICFTLIGLFVNFLIENNSFSFLYQIITFAISLTFLKISSYVFLSITYSIEKISQLINQTKQNN